MRFSRRLSVGAQADGLVYFRGGIPPLQTFWWPHPPKTPPVVSGKIRELACSHGYLKPSGTA